ncbi:peptidoglycan DD-metalloendopeptidase family protein [Pyruvatibacter sp.]|uniref:peptidoglycan DD-metalloendopeptidase family protein n=1 Tax=Pyruvatibacter sp. TaxID=1981328 RepID=UPI0032EC25F3
MSHNSDFLGSVVRGFRRVFTERQFYLRSHGQVQFMALSGWTQGVLALAAVFFLGWVGFTSVNVVFQDQIIAAKDRKFVRMQSAYEQRIAEMQTAYDEVSTEMVLAQSRFLATTSDLEAKHGLLADLLTHSRDVRSQLDDMRREVAKLPGTRTGKTDGETRILLRPAPVEGAFRESRVEILPPNLNLGSQASLPDADVTGIGGAFTDLAQSADGLRHEEKIAFMDYRLENLDLVQQHLVNRIEEETDLEIKEIESIIRMTGFNPDDLAEKMDVEAIAYGGPFINYADTVLDEADSNQTFDRQIFRVATNLDRISVLNQTLRLLPLAKPIYGIKTTSNFGARVDPFNRKLAFHSGIDFAGPYGTPVHAPMEGTVVFAGWRGAYGRFIELDHGNGIKTRYAHLASINVKVGDVVEFRETLGKVGSSGRSTGPHLHYEVWVDGKVQNPAKFLKAGQYVLEEG